MKKVILERDFETFAELTMKDSNSFHAVCLDTTLPIFYLNDVSRNIIAVVEELNRVMGRKVAGTECGDILRGEDGGGGVGCFERGRVGGGGWAAGKDGGGEDAGGV